MKYIKYFEGRVPNYLKDSRIDKDTTKTDKKIINFNNKFKKLMKILGLKYSYNPIYRVVNNSRVAETHNYEIDMNINSVPYSILNILCLPFGFKNEINLYFNKNNFIKTEGKLFCVEFTINVNNNTINDKYLTLKLKDDLYKSTINNLLNLFSNLYINEEFLKKWSLGSEDKNSEKDNSTVILNVKENIVEFLKANINSEKIIIPESVTLNIIKILDRFPSYSIYNKIDPILYKEIIKLGNKENIISAKNMDTAGF